MNSNFWVAWCSLNAFIFKSVVYVKLLTSKAVYFCKLYYMGSFIEMLTKEMNPNLVSLLK